MRANLKQLSIIIQACKASLQPVVYITFGMTEVHKSNYHLVFKSISRYNIAVIRKRTLELLDRVHLSTNDSNLFKYICI